MTSISVSVFSSVNFSFFILWNDIPIMVSSFSILSSGLVSTIWLIFCSYLAFSLEISEVICDAFLFNLLSAWISVIFSFICSFFSIILWMIFSSLKLILGCFSSFLIFCIVSSVCKLKSFLDDFLISTYLPTIFNLKVI